MECCTRLLQLIESRVLLSAEVEQLVHGLLLSSLSPGDEGMPLLSVCLFVNAVCVCVVCECVCAWCVHVFVCGVCACVCVWCVCMCMRSACVFVCNVHICMWWSGNYSLRLFDDWEVSLFMVFFLVRDFQTCLLTLAFSYFTNVDSWRVSVPLHFVLVPPSFIHFCLTERTPIREQV